MRLTRGSSVQRTFSGESVPVTPNSWGLLCYATNGAFELRRIMVVSTPDSMASLSYTRIQLHTHPTQLRSPELRIAGPEGVVFACAEAYTA